MIALRSAIRSLRATPLVSGIAILSLALGIGANTAIFSIVDALILRSLPVEHATRLGVMRSGEFRSSWTNPLWEALRRRPELFDGAFAAGRTNFNAADAGEVDLVDGAFTSGAYFDVLGVEPQLGRFYTPADDARGGGPDGAVAVISHALWQERFGGARDVIGRSFVLNRVAYTVIGVAPREFFGHEVGRRVDVYVPLGTEPLIRGTESSLDRRSTWWLAVFVRTKPGQTLEQASAILATAQAGMREETIPDNWRPQDIARYLEDPLRLDPAASGISSLRRRYERPLMALTAVVAFTLLIACGNIANLLLARASARRHEFAVRTALGASRWRMARQLLAENLVLSALGAAAGVLVAVWGSRLIVSQIATTSNRVMLDIGVDWRMLSFTAVVAIATTLLFGIAPALLATRVPPMEAMKDQGRGGTSGRQARFPSTLVLAQVSLSLMLLVAAGLFVRTFTSLAKLDLGFVPQSVLVMNVGAQRTGIEPEQRGLLYQRMREAALAVPGVTNAALSVVTPVSGSQWNNIIEIPEKLNLPEEERVVNLNYLSEGWFETMRTPIVAGRDFEPRDRVGTPRVAIVNRKFAEKYFDGENPVGKIFHEPARLERAAVPIEIVGLAGDAVYEGLRDPLTPTAYYAGSQDPTPGSSVTLTVRTQTTNPVELTRSLTAALLSVNPDLSMTFRALDDYIAAALSQERLIAMLSGFFGALALLLAALGLYGITAYSVVRRRSEIGIRLALGASPASVVRGILSRTGLLVVSGILLGGLASWWASRFVAALLFGLPPTDPATIVSAMVILAAVSALAGWIPARRAALVDPAEALREG
jgi:predicted permease